MDIIFQVFYNLGTLPEVLSKLMENCHNNFKSQATDLLDIRWAIICVDVRLVTSLVFLSLDARYQMIYVETSNW